jgi:hypothetical protein
MVVRMVIQKSRLIRCAVMVLGALLPLTMAKAANTPIYKCFDKHLALVYTDVPCKDGEQLDLRPGDADPAAVARLERERDQLSLSAAQRIADERHAAVQRDLVDRSRPVIAEPNVADSSSDYGYGYPVVAYSPRTRPRPHRNRPLEASGVAPKPPYMVPRH